jgi:23S rRNA maturation mini-RNase III
MLLKQIYQAMNEKEQKIIKNSYNTRKFFKKIIKDVKTQKKYEQEKQLKIYDFAPIYNIKGYLEKISTNIESLIGRLELKQKRKFEGIARKMLAEQ